MARASIARTRPSEGLRSAMRKSRTLRSCMRDAPKARRMVRKRTSMDLSLIPSRLKRDGNARPDTILISRSLAYATIVNIAMMEMAA